MQYSIPCNAPSSFSRIFRPIVSRIVNTAFALTRVRKSAWVLSLLLLALCDLAAAQMNISVRGKGVDIRSVGTGDDPSHIYPIATRVEWELEREGEPGKYHFFTNRPASIAGKEYATNPIAVGYFGTDARRDYALEAFKADAKGEVLIATSNANLTEAGWVRRSGSFNTSIQNYYLYSYNYNNVGQWVNIPKADAARPTLLFADEGRIKFDNPLPISALSEGVKITYGRRPMTDPNLVIMPNGDYVASARGGPIAGGVFVRIFISKDKGKTWNYLNTTNTSLQHPTLLLNPRDNNLYLLGDNSGAGGIQKSTDGGKTWSDTVSLNFDFRTSPSHVIIAKDRFWIQSEGSGGATVISAPVTADLMKASSWTRATHQGRGMGNEADLVATRNGGYPVLMGKGDYLGRVLSPTVNTTDENTDRINLPGNDSKYSVIYDTTTNKYWALTSYSELPRSQRTGITMYSSDDLKTWKKERKVLEGLSTQFHGFNYPFMQIEGNDIIFVSRTAWEDENGLAQRWHDANMFTFHRIRDFRKGATGGTPPVDPNAGGLIASGKTYKITNVATGRVLNVDGGDVAQGTNVSTFPYGNSAWQKWVVTSIGDGAYKIAAQHSGQVLNVEGGSSKKNIIQWPYGAKDANSQWKIEAGSNGSFIVTCVGSGQALDENTTTNNVDQYPKHGRTNQQWKFEALN